MGRSQFELPDEQVSSERTGINGFRKQREYEQNAVSRALKEARYKEKSKILQSFLSYIQLEQWT